MSSNLIDEEDLPVDQKETKYDYKGATKEVIRALAHNWEEGMLIRMALSAFKDAGLCQESQDKLNRISERLLLVWKGV